MEKLEVSESSRSVNASCIAHAGPLPASWARMPKLLSVNVWNNSLTGTIPLEWASAGNASTPSFPHLFYLDLSKNKLTGESYYIAGLSASLQLKDQ